MHDEQTSRRFDALPSEFLPLILIVGDESIDLERLAESLQSRRFRTVVGDGEKGLQIAGTMRPDLVLLDITMPGMDGVEVCRRLNAQEAFEIPVVFMVAPDEVDKLLAGYEAGGIDYLPKPLQIEDVTARVNLRLTLHGMRKQAEAQNTGLHGYQETPTTQREHCPIEFCEEVVERRRAERRLNERERQIGFLKFALDQAHDAIFLVEPQADFRYRYVNDKACHSLGYSRDELLSMSMSDIDPLVDLEAARKPDEPLLRQNFARIETSHRRKDGHVFPVEVSGTEIEYDGQTMSLSIVRDTTERKAAEHYEQFRSLTLELLSGVDSLPSILEGIVRGVEQLDFEMICSILLLDSQGKHFSKVIAPSLPEFYNAAIAGLEIGIGVGSCGTAAASGKRVIVEDIKTSPYWVPFRELAVRAGLGACWSQPILSSSGQVLGVFAIYHREAHSPTEFDIAIIEKTAHLASIAIERKQSEEALRASEERMRLFFERQLVGMAITSPDKGWLQVNDKVCEMLGYTREELAGLTWAELTYQDDLPADIAQFERVLKGEIDSYAIEKRYVRKDGGIVFAALSVGCVRRADRSVDLLSLVNDISARKRMEAEVQNHLRIFESMDKVNRAIQGSNDLETVLNDVLDTVLSIFDCDRAYFSYPCDPEADAWSVPLERCRPEYPGAHVLGGAILMDEGKAEALRILLDADGPLTYGAGNQHPLPKQMSEQFGFKSYMAMAIYPKGDKPWTFGIQQCSRSRVWTADEQKLFQEIGRRLADGLSSLLAYRDLEASERKFRTLTENTPDFIARYDLDCQRLYVNPAMQQYLDWPVGSVLGKCPMEGSGLSNPEIYQAKLLSVLETGRPDTMETGYRRSNGREGWGHIRFEPEFDAAGHVVGVLAIGRDTTELADSRRDLAESRALLRQLSARSEAAREEERKHISRELHDELGQLLTTLRLNISLMRMQFGADNAELDGIAAECVDVVDATLKSIRGIASALRPLALDMGLVPAIKWQLDQFIEHAGVAGKLLLDDETIAPCESKCLVIFRVLQESLTNIARHALAKRVQVSLGRRDDQFVLKVRDDGQGFDNAAPLRGGGLGLLGMQERALALGGDLAIASIPGAGTELILTIPVGVNYEREKP